MMRNKLLCNSYETVVSGRNGNQTMRGRGVNADEWYNRKISKQKGRGTAGKSIVKTGDTIYKIGKKIFNAAQEFPGEQHIPQYVDGKIKMSQYCGPNTNLKTRLARGDKGISPTDVLCKNHDMAYATISESQAPDKKKIDKVRKADMKLYNDAKKINSINSKAVQIGMKAKMLSEDVGLIDPLKYTRPADKLSPADRLKLSLL
jgi:hypothetical protein